MRGFGDGLFVRGVVGAKRRLTLLVCVVLAVALPAAVLPLVSQAVAQAASVTIPRRAAAAPTIPPQALILGPSTECTNDPSCGLQSVDQAAGGLQT